MQCAFKLKYRPQHINNNLLCITNPQSSAHYPNTHTHTHAMTEYIIIIVKYMKNQKKETSTVGSIILKPAKPNVPDS